MSWKLNPDRPVYMQLIERITTDIIAGIYPPGSKLPSVRDLAQTAGVNPNTMQKALSEMERTNLVYSQRTSGRFITEDLNMIDNLKTELASEQIKEFLDKMQKIGLSKEDIGEANFLPVQYLHRPSHIQISGIHKEISMKQVPSSVSKYSLRLSGSPSFSTIPSPSVS